MQEAKQSSLKKTFWQLFVDWLYLPEGKIGLIRRLTALAMMPCLVWIWNWSKGGPGPYLVPTWRFNDFLVTLPIPPLAIYHAIFIIAAICGLWLILGGKSKFSVLFPTLVFTYFCSVERISALPHYVVMTYIFLVGLCFYKPGQNNLSRRIIQLGVASCYGFACIQRLLAPGHLMGDSFRYTVGSGWAVNDLFKSTFVSLNSVDWLWAPFTVLVIITEVFLTFGFFFVKTRKAAFILGFLLHLSIAITMTPTLITYSLIMVVGYLAFFDGNTESQKSENITSQKPNKIELWAGLIFIALIFIIPCRTFFWFGKDVSTITMSDRDPWSFHMFLYKIDTEKVSIRYKDESDNWMDFPVSKRMKFAASDNDIYGLANYIFKEKPNTKQIEIRLTIKQNSSIIEKIARASLDKNNKLRLKIDATSSKDSNSRI